MSSGSNSNSKAKTAFDRSTLDLDLDLDTGDILLFSKYRHLSTFYKWFNGAIEAFTHSPYCHVAIVIRDPIWLGKGLYVMESTSGEVPSVETHKKAYGVQMTTLEARLHRSGRPDIHVRRLKHGREKFAPELMKTIHSVVHGLPYDGNVLNFLRAARRHRDLDVHETEQMFCSALVAYILVQVGVLSEHESWSEVTPGDFASTNTTRPLRWKDGECPYEVEEAILTAVPVL